MGGVVVAPENFRSDRARIQRGLADFLDDFPPQAEGIYCDQLAEAVWNAHIERREESA